MSEHRSTVAMIGSGSMGTAILHGLVASGAYRVLATTRSEASAAALRAAGIDATSAEADPEANVAAAAQADIVVLGVKPFQIVETLEAIAPSLREDTIVVSVAAGISCAAMEAATSARVIRAMPNTPALVGRGVTGIAAGSRADDRAIAAAEALFDTVGTVVTVPESQINDVAAISGSGPAYFYFVVESFTEAARSLGFDDATARVLVEQTFGGAAELLSHTGEDPAELRRRVTSPKGTTERAIAVLAEAGLPETFLAAAKANVRRSEELAA